MTTITLHSGPVNMNTYDLRQPAPEWFYRTLSPTTAHYYDDVANFVTFLGTDLVYDGAGNFVGGVITDFVEVESGVALVTMTNASADAGLLNARLAAGDGSGVWDLLLSGADIVNGSARSDLLFGLGGNDLLYGNDGDDNLQGQNGNDTLYGGAGRDTLSGSSGNDVLDGGKSSDTLKGGTGADKFVFSSALGATNIDAISDFSVVDDTIQLKASIFKGCGAAGSTLTAARFFDGPAAHDASDRIIYDHTTGALFYDADGNGTVASAVQFAILPTGLAMSELDFKII